MKKKYIIPKVTLLNCEVENLLEESGVDTGNGNKEKIVNDTDLDDDWEIAAKPHYSLWDAEPVGDSNNPW